jgi:hypothetical protein
MRRRGRPFKALDAGAVVIVKVGASGVSINVEALQTMMTPFR